jgi:hypothetical protein
MAERFACPTDNDGFPQCMGDGSTCGPNYTCTELATAQLAARFAERLWESPIGDYLLPIPPELAERVTTDLIIGLLKDVNE